MELTDDEESSNKRLLVKFIKLNDQNADIEELNSIADINGFIAIDTEYESQKDNGCVLIQIATIVNPNTENFITVTPYTYILEQPCLRSVIVYIFEVNEKYIHNSLLKILTSRNLVKIFCGSISDLRRLEYYDLGPGSIPRVIDIQDLVHTLGYQRPSLDNISKKVCGLSKLNSVNWMTGVDGGITLTKKFINYAAYDAYLTLECYLRLIEYDKQSNVQRDPILPNLRQLLEFDSWIRQLPNRPSDITGLIKLAKNSYGSLKDISRQQRDTLIEKMVDSLIKIDQLPMEGSKKIKEKLSLHEDKVSSLSINRLPTEESKKIKEKLSPREERVSSSSQNDNKIDKDAAISAFKRTSIQIPPNGIKIDSYIKCLINSNWNQYSLQERQKFARETVEILKNVKIFRETNDRLFVL